jgi:HPr kinase/phosphorylase
MKQQPSKRMPVRVADYFEKGCERLQLTLEAGKAGMRRSIAEAAINRPGLALTGFMRYFANRRIQVIGMAEHDYLESIAPAARRRCLEDLFAHKIPCVVLTRGRRVFPEILELGEKYRTPVFRSKAITKHFINTSTILMERLMAPQVKVQGTCVEIMGIGVLIEGAPGIGKSDVALGLIRKGYALVSDDITALRLDSTGDVIASPVSITRYHMEIRGLGIIHVPSLFGIAAVRNEKRLDLVVSLCTADRRDQEDRGGEERRSREFLGTQVPQVVIAVTTGRDISNVIEAAALDMKLKRLGHDAEKELDEKLVAVMIGKETASD